MASGRKNTLLQPTKCDDPKEKCVVCGGGRATVQLDTNTFTFGQLISNVIRAGLGFNSPSVIADSTGAEVSVCERESGLLHFSVLTKNILASPLPSTTLSCTTTTSKRKTHAPTLTSRWIKFRAASRTTRFLFLRTSHKVSE